MEEVVNKTLIPTLFFVFLFSSVMQAKEETSKFEFGVRCSVGNYMSVKSAKLTQSEFVPFAVAEPHIGWRPFSGTMHLLELEVSAYAGGTNPYVLGDVKEMTMPTITLKAHKSFGWVDASLGLGGQLTSVSGSYEETSASNVKTKYPSSGGGFGLVVQVGLNFHLYKSLNAGLDMKYTPMHSFSVDFSKTDKAEISNIFTPAIGLNLSL